MPTQLRHGRRLTGSILFGIGFILSPASWWNDAVVNIPLAYLAAKAAAAADRRLFLAVFILVYWATNLIGLLLMHIGAGTWMARAQPKISMARFVGISLVYTLLIVALAQLDIVRSPLQWLKESNANTNAAPGIAR